MPDPSENVLHFTKVQRNFASYVRDPLNHPPLQDVDIRRMQVYSNLVLSNITGFIDNTFPVAKKILDESSWSNLCREFVRDHRCESPYFLEICEAFLSFLARRGLHGLPAFFLELCHYEWVELALDVAVEEAAVKVDAQTDLMSTLVCSSLFQALMYDYPVHQLGPLNQPNVKPAAPTYLLVFRDREDHVRFKQSNVMTHKLLELLQVMDARSALDEIGGQLNTLGHSIGRRELHAQGLKTLQDLHAAGIILGSRR
ncbi:MAG: putative DNA-binding domain-containing protein [Pseudomonadales bacterium]|nr:putative DNA-binding domain-containing protein [Pseudomonadales bacterium]